MSRAARRKGGTRRDPSSRLGGKGVGPPQPHRPSERSWGRKTRAKRKRGRRDAKLRREGEGKCSGEEERSNGARASQGRVFGGKAQHLTMHFFVAERRHPHMQPI